MKTLRLCLFWLAITTCLCAGIRAQAVAEFVQVSTATPIQYLLVDSATGQTGQTAQGGNTTIKISKAGAAGASSAGTITEVDSTNLPGVYAYTPTTSETNTLGLLTLNITCSGCQTVTTSVQVVAFNPNSATAFITGINGIAPPTNWNLSSIDSSGRLLLQPSQTFTTIGSIGGITGTTLPSAIPSGSAIAALILANPANLLLTNGSGYVTSATVTGNVVGSVASVTGSVGSVTGNVGGSVASVTGNVGGNVVGSVASVTGNVTVGGYATNEDPATLLKATTINGHTFVDLMAMLGLDRAGTISSITKSGTSPWTITVVYTDGSATATYVSTFTDNTFSTQSGRSSVTFSGLP